LLNRLENIFYSAIFLFFYDIITDFSIGKSKLKLN